MIEEERTLQELAFFLFFCPYVFLPRDTIAEKGEKVKEKLERTCGRKLCTEGDGRRILRS